MAPTTRFPEGTFAPAPKRAPMGRVLASQTKLESTLIWRHGEQMLLTMIIPLAMLVGFTLVPVLDREDPIVTVFPMVLAVATMSAGFTGQAIAVGFDRRYGALKRIGASALPKWGIIAGKAGAVAIMVTAQFLIFSAAALALGYRAPVAAFALAYVVTMLGTTAFTAMGLLMGGTLGAELILGLANLIWFVLLGAATFVAVGPELGDGARTALTLLPSVALTESLIAAFDGRLAWYPLAVLAAWGLACAIAATRLFRFEAKGD
ncbi:ABC transporter permease [Corynebacterium xerosis]|uniref:ABC transporter permease n=1 Tax=Corynebacterium xerosis TaxID=1725 RepID=A0A7X9SU74_9CORY|nr:ABC transporter permease [Corynebacterium xerosis]NMF08152.1 ABC transporter permease [Corynebacterium xerosis]